MTYEADMTVRIAGLILVMAALAGFFGLRQTFEGSEQVETPSAAASRRSTTAAQVQIAEQQVRDRPDDVATLARLAGMYLQQARETGDSSYYGLADTAVMRASAIAPEDTQVLLVGGEVALAKHDFEGALVLGERARAINPDVVASYGIITDALVELGRYDEATAAAQEMIDRRPDFASYSRASYLRELHGDLAGAVDAMEQAAKSAPTSFDAAWAFVIVGNLQLQLGELDAASDAYTRADQALSGDAMVRAAMARLAMARGDEAAAEAMLRSAVEQRPLPEYAAALGELLELQGRTDEAQEQYALVRATQQLFAASGVDTDIELALFDADHANAAIATYESALAAYGRRPGIFAADTVAWAAFKAGRVDEARQYSVESMRLGSKEPRLLYHAGVIATAAGADDEGRALLEQAVAMSAAQSPLYAAAARDALDHVVSTVSTR
jgi:tetratricopeptide (TPR) repeat protein